jgi:hypothetical protein
MLGKIARRLEATLREERSCPVRVEYGPVTPARLVELRDVVVVEYDRQGGDTVGGPRARGGNPRRRFNRSVACLARIHATSTVAGARAQDHEDRAQALVDQVLCALDDVLRGGELDGDGLQVAGTQHAWTAGRGKFEDLADEAGARVLPGATYVLPFTIERGVHDVAFGGDSAVEFTFAAGSIASRTDVYGSTGEGAGETSCGA